MSPPTFSKSTSMPLGVAAASWRTPVVGLVVDGRVEAELLGQQRALLRPAGDTDDARPIGLGELAGDRADRARRGRDDDRLARLRLADIADPDPGGQPGHPERAHVGARRYAFGDLDGHQRRRVRGDHVLLPASQTLEGPADRIIRILRRDDLPDPAGAHDLTDADRRQVGGDVVDPRAVRRVERDPVDTDQRLAIVDLGDRLFAEFEGVGADASGGAFAEQEATVSIGHERTVPDPASLRTGCRRLLL